MKIFSYSITFSLNICAFALNFFVVQIHFLHAQDQNEARTFFEAGNFSQAQAAYEDMLDDKIAPWQKQIVQYNIATSLLADGKWDEAVLSFEVLSDEGIKHPLLKQRLLSNLALAKVMQIEGMMEALKNHPKPAYEDYNRIYVLYHKALKDIQNAETAWCELQFVEGATNCIPSVYLNEMHLKVKTHLNVFLDDYQNYRLNHATIQQGVSALIFGENSLLDFLNILQNPQVSIELKKDFFADYLAEANSWKELWDKLKTDFKAKSKNYLENLHDLFDQSRQNFLESIGDAEKQNYSGSIEQLKKSQSGLSELLKKLFEKSSPKEVLQQLVIMYGLGLIMEPVQDAYLLQVLETQSAFETSFKKVADASLFASYEKSLKYLKLSLESLNSSSSYNARLFAEVARFYIANVVEQIDLELKPQPSFILKNAIAKQEFVILLNQLRTNQNVNEKTAKQVEQLLAELQELTLTSAYGFLSVVYRQQKEAYTAANSEKSRCQCYPWDEVIPLFSDGYTNAEFASLRLQAGDYRPAAIQHLQKKAIDYWKEALAKLKAQSSSAKQPSKQAEEKQQSEQQEAMEQKNLSKDSATNNAKLNEILRTIQDMESDDQSQPQQVKTDSGKGEERSW